MTDTKRTIAKTSLNLMAIMSLGMIASACATHEKAIPRWDGETTNGAPTSAAGPVFTSTPTHTAPHASLTTSGRPTFTQGCTGSFSVLDTRTSQQVSSGRAFNSDRGLIALDNQGRQTRAVSSTSSQSIIFLPDCNCRSGGNPTSNVSSTHRLAASPPSAATCAAG